jgi:hypothetical protein
MEPSNLLKEVDTVLASIERRDLTSIYLLIEEIPNHLRRSSIIAAAFSVLIDNNDISAINWLLENLDYNIIMQIYEQVIDHNNAQLLRQLFATHTVRVDQLLNLLGLIAPRRTDKFNMELLNVVGESLKAVENPEILEHAIRVEISNAIYLKNYSVAKYLIEKFDIDSETAYRFTIPLLVRYASPEELNLVLLLIPKITSPAKLSVVFNYLPGIYQDYPEDILISLYKALIPPNFIRNVSVNTINDLLRLGKFKVAEFLLPYVQEKEVLLEQLLNLHPIRAGTIVVKLLLSPNSGEIPSISLESKKNAIISSNITSKYTSPNVFKELIIRIYLTAPPALKQQLMEFEEVQTFNIDALLASASKRQLRNPDVAMDYIIRLINAEYAPEGEEGRKVISGYIDPACLTRNIEDLRNNAMVKVAVLAKKNLCYIIDTFKGSFKFEGMEMPCDTYSEEELREVVLNLLSVLNNSELCWILGLKIE